MSPRYFVYKGLLILNPENALRLKPALLSVMLSLSIKPGHEKFKNISYDLYGPSI